MPHGAAASEHVTVKRVGAAVGDECGACVRTFRRGPVTQGTGVAWIRSSVQVC